MGVEHPGFHPQDCETSEHVVSMVLREGVQGHGWGGVHQGPAESGAFVWTGFWWELPSGRGEGGWVTALQRIKQAVEFTWGCSKEGL